METLRFDASLSECEVRHASWAAFVWTSFIWLSFGLADTANSGSCFPSEPSLGIARSAGVLLLS
jgi:hypothetical protein